MTEGTKELILNYWNSWQSPTDLDEMVSYLAPDVQMTSGAALPIRSAKDFRALVEATPDPWDDVRLVDSMFHGEEGTIIYEGINTASKQRMRVAELIRVRDGKIAEVTAVWAQLPPSDAAPQ